MTPDAGTRLLFIRACVAAAALGAVAVWGRVTAPAAKSTPTLTPTQVAELEILSPYLARQPLPQRFVPAPLDAVWSESQTIRMAPRGGTTDQFRATGVPVVRWTVSAIMITESRRVAVVNDSLVSVGASVGGGATIAAIDPDRVILLESGGVRRELRVQSGSQ